MARIIHLDIKNYRGIKHLTVRVDRDQNLICLIGRGDSGKTTILDAISSALSPNWNLNFYDTDFYNGDHREKIEVVVSMIDIPKTFLSENRFGLHVRALNTQDNKIIDDVTLERLNEDLIPALTVKLTVDSSLEPRWVVTNTRKQEDKSISAADRAQFNCYMISDYLDRHFSWNKGNPLYALLKSVSPDEASDDDNAVLQCLRECKEEINKNPFENLKRATELIISRAADLGLDISKATTTLDSRELSIKEGRISLHEESVPFRLKGKGSKRLASIAIQSVLVRNGGIMLIDEVEQGLEPDRIKQAVRSLSEHHAGQMFITTHSRDAITELGSKPLLLLLKDTNTDCIEARPLHLRDEVLQKTVRACPEAFFAKKVIVCEGATEVGICRSMDKWRKQKSQEQMSFKDCAYVDGAGSTIVQRVEKINEAGLRTALFCDADVKEINEKKDEWQKKGIRIFDWDNSLCLEQQVFRDLSWNGVKTLLQYVKDRYLGSFNAAFTDHCSTPVEQWVDAGDLRTLIVSEFAPKKEDKGSRKEWFKRVDGGEALGDIVFSHLDETKDDTRLKITLTGLSDWIDT
jgi:putative ATP-dependent endonuclease of the OLD family